MADRTGQTTHEFTTSRIIKIFFWIWFIGFICGGVAIYLGLKTDNYQRLLAAITTTITTHWWITPLLMGAGIVVVYLKRLGDNHDRNQRPRAGF